MFQARLACGSAPKVWRRVPPVRTLTTALLAVALAAAPLAAARAESANLALTRGSAVPGSTPSLSPLASMWQRHADRVQHIHLGPARFELSLGAFDTLNQRARLFGDYYLTGPGFGAGQVDGGLRLTSGLAIGRTAGGLSLAMPSALDGLGAGRHSQAVAQPYLGLGYSSLSLRAGWAFTADVGLGRWTRSEGPRLGQGGPSDSQVERLLDDLRLSPVIQLGVRYAF